MDVFRDWEAPHILTIFRQNSQKCAWNTKFVLKKFACILDLLDSFGQPRRFALLNQLRVLAHELLRLALHNLKWATTFSQCKHSIHNIFSCYDYVCSVLIKVYEIKRLSISNSRNRPRVIIIEQVIEILTQILIYQHFIKTRFTGHLSHHGLQTSSTI